MKFVDIFPTTIAIENVDRHAEFKEIFTQHAMTHVKPNGKTGETQGMTKIHQDVNFKPIMDYVHNKFIEYLEAFNVDTKMYDYHYVKAWMQALRDAETTRHSHADAMYTWVYYINVPNTASSKKYLCFSNPIENSFRYHSNEGYISMFSHIPNGNANSRSSYEEKFETHEGELFIMPAHLSHWTERADGGHDSGANIPTTHISALKKARVCIAGDIVMSYNEKYAAARPMGLQPPNTWLTYK